MSLQLEVCCQYIMQRLFIKILCDEVRQAFWFGMMYNIDMMGRAVVSMIMLSAGNQTNNAQGSFDSFHILQKIWIGSTSLLLLFLVNLAYYLKRSYDTYRQNGTFMPILSVNKLDNNHKKNEFHTTSDH